MFYYAHRILHKAGFFESIKITLPAVINNVKFKIPIINGTGYYHLLKHEGWFDGLLKQILPNTDGSFVDVGMNIGQTLLKVKSLQPAINYIGFEPNPLCSYYCSKLIAANAFNSCSTYPVGLFDKEDMLTLLLDKDHATGATVLPDLRKNKSRYNTSIKVPVFRGDYLLNKESGKIAVIKADVEGAELEAVKGMLKIIERDKPLLILEILPVYSIQDENGLYRKGRQDELLELLFNSGYKIYRIDERLISLTMLNDIEVHSDLSRTNYVFGHQSNADKYLRNCVVKENPM